MLRILLVTETSGGGTGRHILDLARQFVEQGHHVHLTFSPNRAEASFLQEIAELQKFDGLSASTCEMERMPGFSDFGSLKQLKETIQNHGPFDILHAHSSKAGALVRLLPGRFGKRIYTPHALKVMDPEIGTLQKAIFGTIEACLGRWRSDAIIAVSPMEQDQCVALGIPESRVHLVINGIDQDIVHTPGPTRAELGLPQDLHLFGYVGRFAPQKAPERLINAFIRLGKETKAGLLLVGDGPGRSEMEEKLSAAGLSDKVFFAGLTSARPYYRLMDSFILPSRFESMPYVLLEAAEYGLPILATDVSGSDLMVENGKNGIILPNTEVPEPMIAAMQAMLEPERYSLMKSEARKKIGRYSLSNMAKETLQVYQKALSQTFSGKGN